MTIQSDSLGLMYDQASLSWHQNIRRLGVIGAYHGLFTSLQDRLIHLNASRYVLDVGIGTGALSLALAGQVTSPPHIKGVDISEGMLAQANHNLAAAGVRCTTYRRDATCLPFNNSVFDMVMTAHMLEHLPDPADGLRELVRVLKPGAPLLILTSRRGLITSLPKHRWHYEPLSHIELVGMMKGLRDVCVMPYSRLPWVREMSTALIGTRRE